VTERHITASVLFLMALVFVALAVRSVLRRELPGGPIAVRSWGYLLYAGGLTLNAVALAGNGEALLTNTPSLGVVSSVVLLAGIAAMATASSYT
jgi:hypothetical protein